jgi:thiamine-monophosphate kinase
VGSWDGPLAITITILARPGAAEPVLRSGAKAGDAICVTGSLGGAWRTRRHLTFIPRIAEARVLAGEYGLHAMIDLSDGLSVDLGHICDSSGVGAEIVAASVPVHEDARLAGDGLEAALGAALGDGEDYELLFTLAEADAERLVARQPLPVPVTRIGTIVAPPRRVLVREGGRQEKLRPTGWEHRT